MSIPTKFNPLGLTKNKGEEELEGLRFIAQEDNSAIKMWKWGNPNVAGIQYKTKGHPWTSYNMNDVITLSNAEDWVEFKNTENTLGADDGTNYNYANFAMTGQIAVSGNIQSMLNDLEYCVGGCFKFLFSGCSSLINAPELPATTLGSDCYYGMFQGCSSLTDAPVLSATTLASYCYEFMFRNCTSLTGVQEELPALSVRGGCYEGMFQGCTSLAKAPKILATEGYAYSFSLMFQNCSALLDAPDILISSLDNSNYCFSKMFDGCSSLTGAPELHPLNLYTGCYEGMFKNCISLTDAPVLSATTLALQCYKEMFYGCSSLSSITVNFSDWAFDESAPDWGSATGNWVSGVAASGIFTKPDTLSAAYGNHFIPNDWQVIDQVVPKYLKLTSLEDNTTIALSAVGTPVTSGLQYKVGENGTWQNYTMEDVITLASGEFVEFRNTANTLDPNSTNVAKFATSGKYKAAGEILSMINYAPLTNHCLRELFRNNTALYDVSELIFPSGDISYANNVFSNMFRGCTNITDMPELPATILGTSTYASMFDGCTSLTGITPLPATTLAVGSYSNLFNGCTSLTDAPELPATSISFNNQYRSMFAGCTSLSSITVNFTEWNTRATSIWVQNVAASGIFHMPSALSAVYGDNYIPTGWEIKYTDIEEITELRFTALENGSEISLTTVGSNPPTLSGIQYKVGENGTWQDYTLNDTITLNENEFVEFKNTENTLSISLYNYAKFIMSAGSFRADGDIMALLNHQNACENYCFAYLFKDCGRLVKAPDLPAATLSEYCYSNMFEGCTSLTDAPLLSATTLTNACYNNMFKGCSALTGVQNELPATTITMMCYYGMFADCSSLTKAPALPAQNAYWGCYAHMFKGCSSLTDAPELLPTNINQNETQVCFAHLFNGCSSLSSINVHFTEWSNSNTAATNFWVDGVAASGIFTKPLELPEERGGNRIPQNWTIKYNSPPPTSGLAFYSPLSGTSEMTDETGNYLLTYINMTPTIHDGVPCLYSSGRMGDSYVQTNAYAQSFGTTATWSMWVNFDNVMITFGGYSTYYQGGFRIALFPNSDTLELTMQGGGTGRLNVTNVDLSTDTWHHLVISYNVGSLLKIYWDGTNIYSGNNSIQPESYDTMCWGGGWTFYDEQITKYIAAARIYNRVLSDAEISVLASEFDI